MDGFDGRRERCMFVTQTHTEPVTSVTPLISSLFHTDLPHDKNQVILRSYLISLFYYWSCISGNVPFLVSEGMCTIKQCQSVHLCV